MIPFLLFPVAVLAQFSPYNYNTVRTPEPPSAPRAYRPGRQPSYVRRLLRTRQSPPDPAGFRACGQGLMAEVKGMQPAMPAAFTTPVSPAL